MANEAMIRGSLQVAAGNLSYQSPRSIGAFQADMSTGEDQGGPTPGAILVSVEGTDVDLSQLTTPGLCIIQNLDPTNFVTLGIWDTEAELLFPLLEFMPGEGFPVRLSRYLQTEFIGTGTGTSDYTNQLRLKADTAPCRVLVEAFDK